MVIYQWSDLTEVGGQLGNFCFFSPVWDEKMELMAQVETCFA